METNQNTGVANEAAPKKKSYTFVIILALLVAAGGTWGYTKYNHGLHHEETDDAQVDANISPVIPRISGYITEIRVKDNQQVHKGDTLIVLDNRDQLIRLEQANAALEGSRGNLVVANATTSASVASGSTYIANVSVAEALANKQKAERQLQVLVTQKNAAERQAKAATSQTAATSRQTSVVNANIKARQADIDNAKLVLSYTVITAPTDGHVSKVNAQLGQYLQAGQSLFSIISNAQPWVVANFKETQLTKMKLGQHVKIHIDAYPDHVFDATIASFSPATGARFALLPPDNASGNFVKVVQRLPVRIEFKEIKDEFISRLRPGMNVFVDVELN